MLNEGVDLIDTGGRVAVAHTEQDIDHTIEAFTSTVRQMKEEGLF